MCCKNQENVMKEISVINTKGKEVEKIGLDPKVFDGEVNGSIMHQAVVAYRANQRKGLAMTKTRGLLSGGGKKPWRQKGTGRARVGSSRSPLWRHGATLFGPVPHSFHKDLPKKMKLKAFKSALNAKLNDDEIIVLDKIEFDSPKTKDFAAILKTLKLDGQRVRFVVLQCEDNVKLSSRNIKKVDMEIAQSLTTYTVLDCKKLIVTKDALENIQARITKGLS